VVGAGWGVGGGKGCGSREIGRENGETEKERTDPPHSLDFFHAVHTHPAA